MRLQGITYMVLLLGLLFLPAPAEGHFLDLSELDIDATSRVAPVDSLRPVKVAVSPKEFLEMVKRDRSIPKNVDIRWPRAVRWAMGIYNWFDRNFNSYDSTYVVSTGKKGKLTLGSDNWFEVMSFAPNDYPRLVMRSSVFNNIGVRVNYSVLTLGYSVDVRSIFTDNVAKHKKLELNFACARLFVEGKYWSSSGGGFITEMKTPDKLFNDSYEYEGLKFRDIAATAIYVFNYKKFSYPAAFNLNPLQKKSAGSWMLGLEGAFYNAKFDFTLIPEELSNPKPYPFDSYHMNYNSVTVMGGYSYNWVINKHFLFNNTTLPGVGVAFSFEDSTTGRKERLSLAGKQQNSLCYFNRSFFLSFISKLSGNLFLWKDLAFGATFINFQISGGIRF